MRWACQFCYLPGVPPRSSESVQAPVLHLGTETIWGAGLIKTQVMGPKILRFSQISKLTTVLPKGQKSSLTLQNYLHNEISFKKFLLEFPPLCNDFFFFLVSQMKCLLREKIHMERAWAGWGAGERQTERECHVLWEWFKSLMWGSPSRLMPSHLALSGLEPHIWPDSGPSPFCTSIFYPRRILAPGFLEGWQDVLWSGASPFSDPWGTFLHMCSSPV